MFLVRLLIGRFWFCLGLAMVLAGATAATVGYVGGREATTQSAIVVSKPPVAPAKARTPAKATTRKSGATATKTPVHNPSTPPTTQEIIAETRRRVAADAAVARNAAAISAAGSPANTKTTVSPMLTAKWRRLMWWGGGALVVGLASVGYSLYERPPKVPTSGADELLNDAPPF